ncbi:hypothetical protein, partial [Klebsiella michiganensis]|uniref:hypothetical protein n=1 Tax=Klebsiella michiganensis TaxID=1134687 RepID=UPI00374E13F4
VLGFTGCRLAFQLHAKAVESVMIYRRHIGLYERCRRFNVDSVSVGAQSSHSGGNPISQRE